MGNGAKKDDMVRDMEVYTMATEVYSDSCVWCTANAN